MSKLLQLDGAYYRRRRGKLVQIPPQWVGHTVHRQTIRDRPSKKGQGRKYKKKEQRTN